MSTSAASRTVLLFIDSLGSGGAQRQLVTLANALAITDYKVYLVTYYPFWHFRDSIAQEHVELIYLPRGSKLNGLFIFKLAKLLYTLKPDVILSYLFTPNVLIRLARLMYFKRCKVITSERNIDLQRSRSRLYIEKLMSTLSDVVVTNASATRDMLIENAVCSEDKIKVIRNGVDVGAYTELTSEQKDKIKYEFGIDTQRFLIVLPGRIQVQKNHISLLRALTLVADAGSRCEVLFVGDIIDEVYKKTLDDFIDSKLKNVNINFAGRCDDMNAVYEIADLVVLPSLFEGLPNVVIEAMYKGKLIAISDTSDNAEIVKHGVTGFIHDIDDDQQLAKIIVKVMDLDEADANRMQQAAYDDFMKSYTADALLKNYLDVLS